MKEYDTSKHKVIKPVSRFEVTDRCGGVKNCKGKIMDSSEECAECYRQTIRNISIGKGVKDET